MVALSHATDEALVQEVKSGSEHAWTVLFNRHFTRVMRTLCAFSRENSEWSACDAMSRAWERIDQFRGGNFASWVIGIARNMQVDKSRRVSREVGLFASSEDGLGVVDAIGQVDTQQQQSETAEFVSHMMSALDDDQRKVFVMRHADGMSAKEIGESIGVCEAEVRRRLAGIREILERKIKRENYVAS